MQLNGAEHFRYPLCTHAFDGRASVKHVHIDTLKCRAHIQPKRAHTRSKVV